MNMEIPEALPKKNLPNRFLDALTIAIPGTFLATLCAGAAVGVYTTIKDGPKQLEEMARLKKDLESAKRISYVVKTGDNWKKIIETHYTIDSSKYYDIANGSYYFAGQYAIESKHDKSWIALLNPMHLTPGDTLKIPCNK